MIPAYHMQPAITMVQIVQPTCIYGAVELFINTIIILNDKITAFLSLYLMT